MITTVSDKEMAQAAEIESLRHEITAWSITAENLEAELERERIRLAACGVVAMSDTPDSAAKARQMLPEYESGSLDDVKRRVDECMALRAERDALAADAARYQWLTADLDAVHERVRRNQILARIDSMSYSAACMTIDAVMKEANHGPEEKAKKSWEALGVSDKQVQRITKLV